ncbi:MAG: carboxypeptidase regulatory-like domain-containing protein [Anaerolineales bacterium]|jgi:hypothetical protein
MKNLPVRHFRLKTFAVAGLAFLLLNACTLSLLNIPTNLSGLVPPTSTPASPLPPTSTPQPSAALTFQVTLPAPLLAGENLVLSVVDEVTGLGLNPTNYPMQSQDAEHYMASIPFALNSVIKYRYLVQGALPTPEVDSAGHPVRYRMIYVSGPATVQDVVAAWSGSPFSGSTGQLTGQALDASTGGGIPDILVTAGGEQTLTDSNGTFFLEGLPPGTHNLVAYALDGMYQTFQQGARVEAGRLTPVKISLTPVTLVNVTFTVIVPQGTLQGVPIRLAGNLLQLGNTFSDLDGGLSTVAARMPMLTPMADGRYSLTIPLPEGADIRYKYTLGDGFWNAEHELDGTFTLRQLVVPTTQNPVQVQDMVHTWQAGPSAPILFEVSVPSSTPVSDIVSIQFNPYGWTEPIPMWPRGNNQWVYKLFSPLNILGGFEYRYCRNDQCGLADDQATAASQPGRPVSTSLTPQDLQDTINNWTWLGNSSPGNVVGLQVNVRSAGFFAGVELQSDYDPTWQAWEPLAVQNIKALSANWLVLTPTWTYRSVSPLDFSPVPGHDPLWTDTNQMINSARSATLSVALFPQPALPANAADWWSTAPRTADWWASWFDRYQAFADYHADLAAKTGAQTLILGGDWLTPALPGGHLANGSDSGVPSDADTRWAAILADVRGRYKGSLFWALAYPGGLATAPAFLNQLDGVYLLWSAPLSTTAQPSVDDLHAQAGKLLDSDIQPFQAALQKPVILAVAYPSANGAAQTSFSSAELTSPGAGGSAVNLSAQADLYQALLEAVNERPWISGFVSRGYYPPAILQDASASVHGKPAADLLWYWFPRFLGTTQ